MPPAIPAISAGPRPEDRLEVGGGEGGEEPVDAPVDGAMFAACEFGAIAEQQENEHSRSAQSAFVSEHAV